MRLTNLSTDREVQNFWTPPRSTGDSSLRSDELWHFWSLILYHLWHHQLDYIAIRWQQEVLNSELCCFCHGTIPAVPWYGHIKIISCNSENIGSSRYASMAFSFYTGEGSMKWVLLKWVRWNESCILKTNITPCNLWKRTFIMSILHHMTGCQFNLMSRIRILCRPLGATWEAKSAREFSALYAT